MIIETQMITFAEGLQVGGSLFTSLSGPKSLSTDTKAYVDQTTGHVLVSSEQRKDLVLTSMANVKYYKPARVANMKWEKLVEKAIGFTNKKRADSAEAAG